MERHLASSSHSGVEREKVTALFVSTFSTYCGSLSVCLSVCLSDCLSVCLSACLSVCNDTHNTHSLCVCAPVTYVVRDTPRVASSLASMSVCLTVIPLTSATVISSHSHGVSAPSITLIPSFATRSTSLCGTGTA
jgi:hypothetical protein